MSCIPEVVKVGSSGNIVTLGNRLGPTAEPVGPSASRESLLDPPMAWILRSGVRTVCQKCGVRTHPSSDPQWRLALGFCNRQQMGRQLYSRREGIEAMRG